MSQANFVPMNSDENPLQQYRFVNSQIKIEHQVKSPFSADGVYQTEDDFISKLSYTIDLNYQQSNSEISNFRHRDNFFNYGHVGEFQTIQVPTYTYVEDGETKFIDENGQERSLSHYHEFNGYRDSLVGFTPGASNPSLGSVHVFLLQQTWRVKINSRTYF